MERFLKIEAKESDWTVEQMLRKEVGLTKKQIRHLKFVPNGMKKNGKKCRVNETVCCGDILEIQLEEEQEVSAHLEDGQVDLDILYEDKDLLAVNKPAGVVTHPQGGHYQDTLANQEVAYFRHKGEEHSIRPIGRLDKETSGIVVFAKNKIAAAKLQEQREQGLFSKTYLAVVQGTLPVDKTWYQICKPMKQHPENRLKMIVAEDGKEAITNYQVLGSNSEYSLVKLTLETGRTHQIRVHMASMGHPLVGDLLYGTPQDKESRALLHAWRVELRQPFTREKIELQSEVPEDMRMKKAFLA